jgi:hypothetical protein
MAAAQQALTGFINACRFENNVIHRDYIEALGLKVAQGAN